MKSKESTKVKVSFNAEFEKELKENERLCPACNGAGVKIINSQHSSPDITYCSYCFNGVVLTCPYCGEVLPKASLRCDCPSAIDLYEQERKEIETAKIESTIKYDADALEKEFRYGYYKGLSLNDNFFSTWQEFFDEWFENHTSTEERPQYVWATEELTMALDAEYILESECYDLYEDAFNDISDESIKEMQDFFNSWKEKYGIVGYEKSNRYMIRIPWENIDGKGN